MFIREEALPAIEQAIKETVTACTEMSQSRTGVLLVFERENQLDDILRSGTKINADVSSELLKNIFFIHGADGTTARRLCGTGACSAQAACFRFPKTSI